MSVKYDDYIGFTYNNEHSSNLGIIRTSDGSRFNENLLPTMQDKTVQVPGGDGTYYFGSYFTQRQIPISYAFDGLTEEQVSRIKRLFGDKKIHELVFDENPYKTYYAKVTGTATIKHIPFAEGETNRVYKGEGNVQFTCYQPFARTSKKFLTQYRAYEQISLTEKTYVANKYYVLNNNVYELSSDAFHPSEIYYKDVSNTDEWAAASGMKQNRGTYDCVVGSKSTMVLYNPGDLESDFIFTIKFVQNKIAGGKISISGDASRQLEWESFVAQSDSDGQNLDDCVKINSKLNLIEGYRNGQKTGHVYNKHVTGGSFFKIPANGTEDIQLILSDFGGSTPNWSKILPYDDVVHAYAPIEYSYYYF